MSNINGVLTRLRGYVKGRFIFCQKIDITALIELAERQNQHIKDGVAHDNAIQQEYEKQPDAAERGIGDCICTWCTDSVEILEEFERANHD